MDKIMAVALGTCFIGIFIGLAFGLFIGRKLKIPVYEDLLKKTENTIKKIRSTNAKLRRENLRLRREHQALYDCIERWYEPTNEKALRKLVEETGKLFKGFMEVELGKEIEDETSV